MISYVIAHKNRLDLLECNLISFTHQSSPNFEIVLVDNSDDEHWIQLKSLVTKYRHLGLAISAYHIDIMRCPFSHGPETFSNLYNPALQQNIGAKQARGDIIVLTSPEVVNAIMNVEEIEKSFRSGVSKFMLGWVSEAHRRELPSTFDLNAYEMRQICPTPTEGACCRAERWSPVAYFLGSIKKVDFIRVGGIEERFMAGMAHDDNFFVRCIQAHGITPILNENVAGIHLYHSRMYQQTHANPNYSIYHGLVRAGATKANEGHLWGSENCILESF